MDSLLGNGQPIKKTLSALGEVIMAPLPHGGLSGPMIIFKDVVNLEFLRFNANICDSIDLKEQNI